MWYWEEELLFAAPEEDEEAAKAIDAGEMYAMELKGMDWCKWWPWLWCCWKLFS